MLQRYEPWRHVVKRLHGHRVSHGVQTRGESVVRGHELGGVQVYLTTQQCPTPVALMTTIIVMMTINYRDDGIICGLCINGAATILPSRLREA